MTSRRTIALVQFDAVPEEAEANLAGMERLVAAATAEGARWVVFHEATLTDYTAELARFAEAVPAGKATLRMIELAKQHECFISFGLSEVESDRYYIAQVFVGPAGYVYHYRKTWLCRKPDDEGHRNEWERYDPGNGPELFEIDGVRATCFVCSDGCAPRCVQRAAALRPQVVFYPQNVRFGVEPESVVDVAREIGAPVLVTNRVGRSWTHESPGGSFFLSAAGEVLAQANMDGREEVLVRELEMPARN